MKKGAMQHGAALLGAMLTVALVASLASAALWLQWRQVEVEIAERARAQNQWLMVGALDWTRLILAEDARSALGVDHLGEPWALPVQEARLSSFLSQDRQWRPGDPEVFLSGQITDAQSRLNLASLVQDGQISAVALTAWSRLFERLGLPPSELATLTQRWTQSLAASRDVGRKSAAGQAAGSPAALLPQRVDQLAWLGLSTSTLAQLQPYVTVLPVATAVNLNTASAPVLEAVVPGLDAGAAQALVEQRSRQPWNSLQEVAEALGPAGRLLDERQHSVRSRFFEIRGRLRIEQQEREELALVERMGSEVRMLWRVSAPATAVSGNAPAGRSLQ